MGAVDIIENTLIWCLLLILLPLPLLGLFVYKSIVTLIAKLTVPNLYLFRTPDAMVSSDLVYSVPIINIGMICKIDGVLDVKEVRQLFQTKLLDPMKPDGRPKNGNLYCYMERFGGYNFKRSVPIGQIKLEDHIIEESFNKQPGQSDADALSSHIAKVYYSGHTYGKPLWRVSIVKTSDKSCMLFFCIHHSMGDGYSLIYLMDQLTGIKTPILTTPFKETLWDKIKLIARAPTTLGGFFNSMGSGPNPFPSSGIDTKHNYALVTLDLLKVKSVRKQTGDGTTHVLSILFTILGGVFRHLLVRQGKCKSEEDLPEYMYLASSLAWPSHPRNKMCNEWTVGTFRVPIKNPEPMERLLETEKAHNEFFAGGANKLVKRLMVPVMSLLPACVGESMGNSNQAPMASSWAAIAAGDNYKLLGLPVDHIFPIVGFTHRKMTWINISMSHSNKIDVTMTVNSEFVENCEELNQVTNKLLNEELDKLLDACKANKEL